MGKSIRDKVRQKVAQIERKRREAPEAKALLPAMPQQGRTLRYLRSGGIVALLVAVASLVMDEYFWFASILILIGVGVLLVDTLFDDTLGRTSKIVIGLVIILLGLAFALGIVWPRKDPFRASVSVFNHASNEQEVAGIPWLPEFTDVRLSILNAGNGDLRDISIAVTVQPDAFIERVVQLTKHANIEVRSAVPWLFAADGYNTDHASTASWFNVPSGQWQIQCERLKKGDYMDLLLVVVGKDVRGQSRKQVPNNVEVVGTYKYRFSRPMSVTCSSRSPSFRWELAESRCL